MVRRYEDDFDFTVIYTPDSDLMCLLSDKVGIMRYKTAGRGGSGHTPVSVNNFEEYMSGECKCQMRFNTIILYKCLVGDKSDVIKGVRGFGPKAFDKCIGRLDSIGVDYKELINPDKVGELIKSEVDYLGEKAVEEALYALELVRGSSVTDTERKPVKTDSLEKREKAYMKYLMKSLVS